ncbi:MAG: hypothetical protein AMXMBFR64_28060 [Myxococcales bacterium]
MQRRALPIAAALLLVVSCGDDGTTTGPGDAGDASAVDGISPPADIGGLDGTGTIDGGTDGSGGPGGTDGAPPSDVVPGGFGAPCTANADCLSGYCVEGPEGYICTEECAETCDPGFDCKGVVQGPDIIFLCVPVVKKVCTPCTKDFHCNEGACLEIDGQRRCSYACAGDGDCPASYVCTKDATGEHEGAFCQPVTGTCECTEPLEGTQRTCLLTTDAGTCYGVESCDPAVGWVGCTAATPEAELCNGKDDDCNGLVDDGIADGAACVNEVVGVGTCPGQTVCLGPLGLVCQGPVPAIEACDGKDNDCDGATDEDFKGDDGEFSTDAHCGACNNDCATAIANGTGTCDPDDLQCVVASCAPGFVQVGPYACAATVELPCKPCTTDEDCLGSACVPFDGASYCLVACQGEDKTCPQGYSCGDPGSGEACLPANGTCTCNVLTAGKKQVCYASSDLGSCVGLETCDPATGWQGCDAPLPATEICNGVDDDCDGLVDEDLTLAQGCTNDVAGVGSCPGTPVCLGPLGWTCQGPKPEPEACDFKDNDCDGLTDEDFRDGAGFWTLEGHCGTCGNDCATKIENGVGKCGGSPEVPACVVASCNSDYVKLNDFQCGLPPNVSCVPCTSDSGCFGGSCVTLDGQQVCVSPCGKTGKSCPSGHTCQEIGGAERCVPVTGSCTCTPDVAGETRGCKASNAFGSCFGQQTCDAAMGWTPCSASPPEPEICNGKDDDCDGAIDDGVIPPAEPCEESNASGTCTGIWYCAFSGGVADWTCSASTPAADVCDYLDNDCDGLTDEDFVDPVSKAYVNDAHCGACGVSCAGAIPNATAACALAGGTPRCEVQSCKAGYYKAGPLTCLPVADSLCQPCQTDANCPTPGDVCLTLDGGGFCGRDCGAGNLHGTPEGQCPASYACIQGGGVKQCQPLSGSCTCLPGDGGKTRTCLQTNGFGTCFGSQACNPAVGWGACSAQVPAAEVCNGTDDDCNQVVDDVAGRGAACTNANAFGTCAGTMDCVAGSAALVCAGPTPAAETCNGKDDDCDGQVDEGFPDLYQSCSAGKGACQRYGFFECTANGAGTVCNAVEGPTAPEKCNGIDDDCDGLTDETFATLGTVCTAGEGACKAAGIVICTADGAGTQCSATQGTGGTEVCNGIDDDCDGQTDEGLTAPACANQKGVCAGSKQTCGGLEGWRACTGPEYGAKYEPTELTCDGLDNNCDGTADNGLPPHPCPNQVGVCAGSFATCGGAAGWATCGATQYGAAWQSSETTCDSLDNDCDGATDEGYKNPGTGKYDSNTACGSCFTNCTTIFAKPNAYGVCNATGAPTCKMLCCAPGVSGCSVSNPWFDLNLVPDDGCEFQLDPAAIYVSVDDTNADNNAGCGRGPVGTGANNRPCKAIATGINEAVAAGRTKVLVADGLYQETVTVANGVSLLGGYRADNWERHLSTTLTTVRGTGGSGIHKMTIIVGALTKATTIEGFTIEGQANTQVGGNSYGIYVSSATSFLTITSNLILGGSGGPGADQTAGAAGVLGVDGKGRNSAGVVASTYDAFIATGSGYCNASNNRQHANGGVRSCGADNVNGGNGGGNHCEPDPNGGEGSSTDGFAGQPGDGALGGAAGPGGDAGNDGRIEGSLCYLPNQTMTGLPGINGKPGVNGAAGGACSAAGGSVSGGHWAPATATAGSAGGPGGGGGGGGAGGGGYCWSCAENKDRLGAHGGGGGSGGCGGATGAPGGGAGGAFGIFVVGTQAPAVSKNTILRGAGGKGGNGGNGGVGGKGGNGGDGGTCPGNCFCFSDAGKGGEGGSGGHGGGGGGGCGGVSFGIYTSGIGSPGWCAAASGNTVSGGLAGPGGLGGLSLGNSGPNGATGSLGTCSFN